MRTLYCPITICITIILHFVWALGLSLDPGSIYATALHTILTVARDPAIAAVVYASVATLAAVGLVYPRRSVRVFLILPQQIVLWFSVIGAAYAMLLGQYADGTQRTSWFLVVDQVPIILIAFGHTAALLLIAGERRE